MCPQTLARMGTFDEAGNIRHDQLALMLVDDHSQVGCQRGKGVGRDFRPGRGDAGNKGGLARVGQPQEADIGKDLEFEADVFFHARFSRLRETRHLHDGRLEMRIALTAAPAFGHDDLLAVLGEVGDQPFLAVHFLENLGAHGHLDDLVFAGATVAQPPATGPTAFGFLEGSVTIIVKGQQVVVGSHDNVAALAPRPLRRDHPEAHIFPGGTKHCPGHRFRNG